MYSPSATSGSRSSQGGNPNLGFVLGALLLLLVGLVVYIFNRPAQEYTLLKQLPPEAVSTSEDRQSAGNTGNQINPNGEKLLNSVLSKPSEPAALKPEDEKKRKEDEKKAREMEEQDKDAAGATPDAAPVQPAGDSAKAEGAKATAQFTGTTEYAYTVKPGETLFRLASRFRNPATQIKSSNSLADENVAVGQQIKIKVQGIHKVGAGEGLNAIARTYGVSVADLRKANELAGDQIKLGQELIVPVQ